MPALVHNNFQLDFGSARPHESIVKNDRISVETLRNISVQHTMPPENHP